jgi:hypothetical protein
LSETICTLPLQSAKGTLTDGFSTIIKQLWSAEEKDNLHRCVLHPQAAREVAHKGLLTNCMQQNPPPEANSSLVVEDLRRGLVNPNFHGHVSKNERESFICLVMVDKFCIPSVVHTHMP